MQPPSPTVSICESFYPFSAFNLSHYLARAAMVNHYITDRELSVFILTRKTVQTLLKMPWDIWILGGDNYSDISERFPRRGNNSHIQRFLRVKIFPFKRETVQLSWKTILLFSLHPRNVICLQNFVEYMEGWVHKKCFSSSKLPLLHQVW